MPLANLSVIDALRDPRLFGGLPAFRDLTSWATWLVFIKAAHGLPLPPQSFVGHFTGGHDAPPRR